MPTPSSYYKLGLLTIVSFIFLILVGVLVVHAINQRDTILYHSYFNESVQGLDVGAPVKFRGVAIGRVSGIEIAPDHRMVDISCELDTKDIVRMGLSEDNRRLGNERFAIPEDLRAQLNSQGITGVKYVAIDFFSLESFPAPQLTFKVPPNRYIPAAPSMMKSVEDTITKAMERLPDMADSVVLIMGRIDDLLSDLKAQNIAGNAVATLERVNTTLATLQRTLIRVDKQDLGSKAASALTEVNVSAEKLNRILDVLGDSDGLVANANRATVALVEVGRTSQDTQKELEKTLRDIGEAADAVRGFVIELERDPDMLLKGKSPRTGSR